MQRRTAEVLVNVLFDEDSELSVEIVSPDGDVSTNGLLGWGLWHVSAKCEFDSYWCDYELLGLELSVRFPEVGKIYAVEFPRYRRTRKGMWRTRIQLSWVEDVLRTCSDPDKILGFAQLDFRAEILA